MLTLGIDTSTDIAAIGLIDKDKFIGELNISLHHQHSERLLVNIDHLFKESDYQIDDLEGLAVGLGPGSFTGLRIGLTTIKTFVQTLKIPVIGLSTLDILAYNKYQVKGWIVPVIDARRERVYTSIYRGGNRDIKKQKIKKDEALSLEKLYENLNYICQENPQKNNTFYLIGDGIISYREQFKKMESDSHINISYGTESENIPAGGIIADLGQYYLEKGEEDKPEKILPNYLKKPQAEINW